MKLSVVIPAHNEADSIATTVGGVTAALKREGIDYEVLALTEHAVEEHLYAAGLQPTDSIPRFLPYSFRERLPASPRLVSLYLRFPPAWKLLGKQFLVIAERRPDRPRG